MAIPEGYRLLTSEDVGKVFGVDLESVVYFDTSVYPQSYPSVSVIDLTNFISHDFMGNETWSINGTPFISLFDYLIESYTFTDNVEITFYNTDSDYQGWNNFLYVKDKPDPYNITLTKPKLTVKCANAIMEKDLVVQADKWNGSYTPDELYTIETLSTTLPTGAQGITSATVGTKIYLFGGSYYISGEGMFYSNTINVFNTETNTITTLSATLPTGADNIACGVVGTKIYLFGGQSSISSYLKTINVFDTETNTISTLSTTLPVMSQSITAIPVGTKIYLIGGSAKISQTYALTTINVFDTETDTISTLLDTFPNPTTNSTVDMAGSVLGNKIYLFGGGITSYCTNIIRVFDIETNTIETLSTTLPKAAFGITSNVINNRIYLFGGSGYNSTDSYYKLNTINIFDAETNTIETLSITLPAGTYDMASAILGTKIYLFGGQSGSYSKTINLFKADFSGTVLTDQRTIFLTKNKMCTEDIAVMALTQEKHIVPTTSSLQEFTPSEGYIGFSKVSVKLPYTTYLGDATGAEPIYGNPNSTYSFTNIRKFSSIDDGYYQATDVVDTYALCKITITADGTEGLVIDYTFDGDDSYCITSNLNTTLSSSTRVDSANVFFKRYSSFSDVSGTIDYGILSEGTYFIYIKYLMTGDYQYASDKMQFRIRFY